jgi:hypothetical protein
VTGHKQTRDKQKDMCVGPVISYSTHVSIYVMSNLLSEFHIDFFFKILSNIRVHSTMSEVEIWCLHHTVSFGLY